MKIVIRQAEQSDLPALIRTAERFFDSDENEHRLVGTEDRMKELVRFLIWSSDGCLLVSERNGNVNGMIGLIVFEHPYATHKIATELFWLVDRQCRGTGIRLLKRAQQWAAEAGASFLQMTAPNPKTGRVYERLGYNRVVEESYKLDLGRLKWA